MRSNHTRYSVSTLTAIAVILGSPLSAQKPADSGHGPDPQATPAVASVAKQAPVRATGSLWTTSSRAITEDNRAHRVGDVITIVVQESATASSSANTKASRSDSAKFNGVTGGMSTLNHLLTSLGSSADNSIDGQGQTNRTGSLVTKLTVVVTEVLAGGNMRVEGTREMTVNKEKQKVTISGIIRPQDVGPGNTVSSIALANASIQFDGKGPVGDRQKRGLISTVFGWLF